MTVLYLSPHCDDVVLSCAARIARETAAGERVVVATVFSAGGEDRASRAAASVRAREDRAALRSLGAESRHLGLADAPMRPGLTASYASLVLGPAPEDALLRTLSAVVAGLVAELAPRRVCLPLGVGGHIDHRAVFRSHLSLPGEVAFYEDRPYAGEPAFVVHRLVEIGASVAGMYPQQTADDEAAFLAAFDRWPHLLAYASGDPGTRDALARAHWRWRRVEECQSMRLDRLTLLGDESDLARAGAAILHYRSQLDALFCGPQQVVSALRAMSANASAAYVERMYVRSA